MGEGIHSSGETAHHSDAGIRELVGEFFGAIRRVVRGFAGSNDADGMAVAFQNVPHHVKHGRGIMNVPQQGGVIRRGECDDSGAVLLHQIKFARKVHVAFPIGESFCRLGAYSGHRLQTRDLSRENSHRRSEGLQ